MPTARDCTGGPTRPGQASSLHPAGGAAAQSGMIRAHEEHRATEATRRGSFGPLRMPRREGETCTEREEEKNDG